MAECIFETSRFYNFGDILPFEEDSQNEFKGHRNLCVEELPPWCFYRGSNRKLHRSRRAISRSICGFLSSGQGGTIYMGVTDDGCVKGLCMSLAQTDHMRLALRDVLSRFQPCVSVDQVKTCFVPVLLGGTIKKWREKFQESRWSVSLTARERQHPHRLRTYEYCWCDLDTQSQIDLNCWLPSFVIELTILPQKPLATELILSAEENWPGNVSLHRIQLPVFYQDEEGRCYVRGQAGLHEYTAKEVVEVTSQEVVAYYQPIVERMRSLLFKLSVNL